MEIIIRKEEEKERYVVEYKKACCKEMESALSNRYISYGDISMESRTNQLSIFQWRATPERVYWDEEPVRICPFCGGKLIYVAIGPYEGCS